VRRLYSQSSRFTCTKAQVDYLRAIHKGEPSDTNAATRNRCFRLLEFRDGSVFVKPEVVKQLGLDK
jgi:hypothetical protein